MCLQDPYLSALPTLWLLFDIDPARPPPTEVLDMSVCNRPDPRGLRGTPPRMTDDGASWLARPTASSAAASRKAESAPKAAGDLQIERFSWLADAEESEVAWRDTRRPILGDSRMDNKSTYVDAGTQLHNTPVVIRVAGIAQVPQ